MKAKLVYELAKNAFTSGEYKKAVELFEKLLVGNNSGEHLNAELFFEAYLGYGDSLAYIPGSLSAAFDVYHFIFNQSEFYAWAKVDRLKNATNALIDSVRQIKDYKGKIRLKDQRLLPASIDNSLVQKMKRETTTGLLSNRVSSDGNGFDSASDPFLCPVCDDVFKFPVTISCGHTYCRHCLISSEKCRVCLTTIEACHWEKDVFISRLVERWWGAELKTDMINEDAKHFLNARHYDEALRCANESLEQAPNCFNGLLIRSEVLFCLNQFQSSLADAENALRSRPTSSKAHYRRAVALSILGRYEEALVSYCLAASFDKSGVLESVRHDMTRTLYQMIAPQAFPRSSYSHHHHQLLSLNMDQPHRKRRKLYHSIRDNVISVSDCEDEESKCYCINEEEKYMQRMHKRSRRSAYSSRIRPYSIGNADDIGEVLTISEKGMIDRLPEINLITENLIPPQPLSRMRIVLDRVHQEVGKIKQMDFRATSIHVNRAQIEASDFDCVLCCRTLWRPVVTPCGHTYCSICLDRCMDYKQQCPLCMTPIIDALSLTKRNPTHFLEMAMQRFIPAPYAKRQIQELEPSVPIFICTTAFPNVPCPLLVSEPRYRLMVRQAIESGDRQFGMAQPIGLPTQNGRQQYFEYGTMLDIRDCVLLENGYSILSTVGSRRFRVMARGEKDGYDTAKVEFICDNPISKDSLTYVTELHEQVFYKAICWFNSLPENYKTEIIKSFGLMPELENDWKTIADGPAWAWWIIAILPLNQQLKGTIVAEINLEKRLKAIDKTLLTLQDKAAKTAAQKRRNNSSNNACNQDSCNGGDEGPAITECPTIDCCQRTVAATSTSVSLDERTNANQSTQFLL